MKTIVFMVEEASMEGVLEIILPKIFSQEVKTIIIPHEGKSDLKKSIPIKLKGFNVPNSSFVVLIDQDSDECIKVKNNLKEICQKAGRADTVIRIVCKELESWFLGDLNAVSEAFNVQLKLKQDKKKFREPDNLGNAHKELLILVPYFQKVSGAKKIAEKMDLEKNRSKSFNSFIRKMRELNNSIDAS